MPSSKVDLLLHPVRLRILTAISMQRATVKDLAQALPDIPQTTLYRHINALVEGGVLKIVEENPVRGTVERVYQMAGPPSLSAEDLHGMSKQESEQAFTTFLSTLMSDAQRYLDRKPDGAAINLLEDGVEVSKVQVFLDEREYREVVEQFERVLLAAAQKPPGPDRKRRILTYLFIPGEA